MLVIVLESVGFPVVGFVSANEVLEKMKAIEFNKIEPTWFKIEENTKKKCIENSVEYYNYLGCFIRYQLFNYIKKKALIETIKHLDFSDIIGIRAILNKRHFSSKERELELAKNDFYKNQKQVFDWLDTKTKDPYFFILNPEVLELK